MGKLCLVRVGGLFALGIMGTPWGMAEVKNELLSTKPTVLQEVKAAAQAVPASSESKEVTLPAHTLPDAFALLTPFFVFLLIIAGGVGLYFFSKRSGSMGFFGKKTENKLQIVETRMLGNKQFLVVVQYESQKILLGVGPGMIEHLCFLQTPYPMEELEADSPADKSKKQA